MARAVSKVRVVGSAAFLALCGWPIINYNIITAEDVADAPRGNFSKQMDVRDPPFATAVLRDAEPARTQPAGRAAPVGPTAEPPELPQPHSLRSSDVSSSSVGQGGSPDVSRDFGQLDRQLTAGESMRGDDLDQMISQEEHAQFYSVICPFFSTLVRERAIPIKPCYPQEELEDFTMKAGIDEEDARAHGESNFRNFPPGFCMNLFRMEGEPNEHGNSTGCCDCITTFVNCLQSKDDNRTMRRCEAVTFLCHFPRKNESMAFFDTADRNNDSMITVAEVEQSQGEFATNDANPSGEGTILGSFTLLIRVFGEWPDRMSRQTFIDVVVLRRFPGHYSYPAPRPMVVQEVLSLPPSSTNRDLQWAMADSSRHHNDLTAEPIIANEQFNGDAVTLEGQLLRANHSNSLDVGSRRYRDAFTVALSVMVENIAGDSSPVLVKKGGGLHSAANETDWTAGWGLGQNFNISGLSYVARNSSTAEDAGRCEGVLLFDGNKTWGPLVGKWADIAVVFDKTHEEVSLWLDAQRQVSTGSLRGCEGSWSNTEELHIGSAFGRVMRGKIRAFRIYNGTASPQQIADWATTHRRE